MVRGTLRELEKRPNYIRFEYGIAMDKNIVFLLMFYLQERFFTIVWQERFFTIVWQERFFTIIWQEGLFTIVWQGFFTTVWQEGNKSD